MFTYIYDVFVPNDFGFIPGRLDIVVVLALYAATYVIIRQLGGRAWSLVYVALIPFLNWAFGFIGDVPVVAPNDLAEKGISLHPLALVTGAVFVVRDFVQREIGQRVLILMAIAIGWSVYYAPLWLALASGLAFAISEGFDWLVYTLSKYRLSTRILLSSAVAAPIDTAVFLYGADISKQLEFGADPGNSLHLANYIVILIGKMITAYWMSRVIRAREDRGLIDPAAA